MQKIRPRADQQGIIKKGVAPEESCLLLIGLLLATIVLMASLGVGSLVAVAIQCLGP